MFMYKYILQITQIKSAILSPQNLLGLLSYCLNMIVALVAYGSVLEQNFLKIAQLSSQNHELIYQNFINDGLWSVVHRSFVIETKVEIKGQLNSSSIHLRIH